MSPCCGREFSSKVIIPTVYPSGFAFLIAAWPIAPPPPVLFSTVIVVPSCFSAAATTARRTASVPPPAAHGQITVIALPFLGYAAFAKAVPENSMSAAETAAAVTHTLRFIYSLLFPGYSRCLPVLIDSLHQGFETVCKMPH